MQTLKKIFIFSLFIIALAACKDDNVPEIDKTKVEHEQLLGTWEVVETEAFVNIDPKYKSFLSLLPFDLNDELKNKLDEKSANTSFHFEKENVYFIKNAGIGFIRDSSRYILDEYKIQLDNPNLIGFYAPTFYIKFTGGLLVAYLRKSETIDLLNNTGEITSFQMDLLREGIDAAQCELRFRRRETS
ncbi:MAG: hypothetical protein LBR52_04965, partial [Prevotellaceae bacterium]|nr:hypothetical protein [Prevotellaceae bacterium]